MISIYKKNKNLGMPNQSLTISNSVDKSISLSNQNYLSEIDQNGTPQTRLW